MKNAGVRSVTIEYWFTTYSVKSIRDLGVPIGMTSAVVLIGGVLLWGVGRSQTGFWDT